MFTVLSVKMGSERAFTQQVANNDESLVVLSKEDVLRIEQELSVLHGQELDCPS